jgi:acetyl esterase/lipase
MKLRFVFAVLFAGACLQAIGHAASPASRLLQPEAKTAAQEKLPNEKPPAAPVVTPTSLPGAETFIYHDVKPEPMRLFVFKHAGWKATDRRPAWIHFFGGGFVNGTPLQSASQGRNAAKLGMVGIAVDYRVYHRHGTDASACVADARAALHWVQAHAAELGLDPERVVVSGSSAGGHLALWTAIAHTPWGSDPAEAPLFKPAALILISAAADTSASGGQRSDRFAGHGTDLSATQNLDRKMPPVLMFHGDADTTVPYHYAVELNQALVASGNDCEFVTMPGGGHGLGTEEWKTKAAARAQAFLERLKILPVATKP